MSARRVLQVRTRAGVLTVTRERPGALLLMLADGEGRASIRISHAQVDRLIAALLEDVVRGSGATARRR